MVSKLIFEMLVKARITNTVLFRGTRHLSMRFSPSLLNFLRICDNVQLLNHRNSLENWNNGVAFIRRPPPCVCILSYHKPHKKRRKKQTKTHFSEQIASHWSTASVDSCFMRAFSGKAVYRTQACKDDGKLMLLAASVAQPLKCILCVEGLFSLVYQKLFSQSG